MLELRPYIDAIESATTAADLRDAMADLDAILTTSDLRQTKIDGNGPPADEPLQTAWAELISGWWQTIKRNMQLMAPLIPAGPINPGA